MRVIWILIPFFLGTHGTSGVSVKVGKASDGFVEQISTPATSVSTEVEWIPLKPPLTVPTPIANPTPAILVPINPALPGAHLGNQPIEILGLPGTPNLPEEVLNALPAAPTPVGNINLTRAGTNTRTALIGGTVRIEPYLFTYNTASMIVRLYEADGTEVLFSGKPLLQWRRTDDMDASGVHFRGVRDASSMVITAGDPSPRTGLSYSFTITASQKIRASMSGNPVAGRAYLRVNGPAGMF